jgi:hypothetical protein
MNQPETDLLASDEITDAEWESLHKPSTLTAPTDSRIANGRPNPDTFRAQLAQEVADAEKELTRDQKALAAAEQKVADLRADVAFDEMRVASRVKGLDTFDRLQAKAAK